MIERKMTFSVKGAIVVFFLAMNVCEMDMLMKPHD